MKACCGFGHRTVLANIDDSLYSAVINAVDAGYDMFYTGAIGEFDTRFSSAVRKAKVRYPQIKLVCIKPYFTNDLNINKEYYCSLYDDIIIPPEIIGIYYKAAIKPRNQWMVDHCDLIISYVIRSYGGATQAVRYACNQGRHIINLGE
ncbi:MAG: DUF1273 domain-containing protein [Ruminococcus sp.]|nr:DUF1273 domain-containing protein [Ruminococcus sp.]